MSLRSIGKRLIETAARLGLANARWAPRFLRPHLRSFIKPNHIRHSQSLFVRALSYFDLSVLKPHNLRLSKNLFVRAIQKSIRPQHLFRPFSTSLHFRPKYYDSTQAGRLRRLFRVQKQKFPFLDHVKNVFSTNQRYNAGLLSEKYPNSIDGYDIGKFIAVGCNAAVYELRVSQQNNTSASDYPLALKLMFNFDFSVPEKVIMREMINELVPLTHIPSNLPSGQMGKFRPLNRSHPNVIKLHTAFIDRFPNIEGAELIFPEALPSTDIFGSMINEPKTLFIVMKRYRMTLREYVLSYKRNYWAGRVMFGQLLEALVFLYNNSVSHRDLKSDNILLDFDNDDDIPHLVLSDFGSAQTTSFILHYENEFTDLGGNLSLRAPEIRRASPGTTLNYHLADTWAAGTIAYEIFTRMNPFYSKMNSASYTEEELPNLPSRLNNAVKSVVSRMLKIDPGERPLPSVSANVVTLSLFRFGSELTTILKECGIALELYTSNLKFGGTRILDNVAGHLDKQVDQLIGLFASETIMANSIAPRIISKSELQLRASFLARVDRSQVWNSLEYFVDGNTFENCSTISSASTAFPVYCN